LIFVKIFFGTTDSSYYQKLYTRELDFTVLVNFLILPFIFLEFLNHLKAPVAAFNIKSTGKDIIWYLQSSGIPLHFMQLSLQNHEGLGDNYSHPLMRFALKGAQHWFVSEQQEQD